MERILSLLNIMGNPHENINCVHIAGTNGKGSTSVMIEHILKKAGYKVGRFLSPHLHSYLERFAINGKKIEAGQLKDYLDYIENCVSGVLAEGFSRPTEFEVLTAVAFKYFHDQGVDIAVIETGMGGIYDSTNVMKPLLSIITGIDHDHTDFLGSTLMEIAANKAGIIKRGIPIVAGVMEGEALRVIEAKAESEGSQLILSNQYKVYRLQAPSLEGQILNIEGPDFYMEGVKFSLLGDFQLNNLATVISAIRILQGQGYNVQYQHIREALTQLEMPGRLEIIQYNPLVIADVAHNPQAAKAVSDSLDKLLPGREKLLLCGILDDKDIENILKPLGENTRACVVTKPVNSRGKNWQNVGRIWSQIFPDKPCLEAEVIAQAVKIGLELLEDREYLLITGSFYVLDQARNCFLTS